MMASYYFSSLLKVSKTFTCPFEVPLPAKYDDRMALLGKLSYGLTDSPEAGAQWAVVHGGNEWVLYYAFRDIDGQTSRLVSSPILSLEDRS